VSEHFIDPRVMTLTNSALDAVHGSTIAEDAAAELATFAAAAHEIASTLDEARIATLSVNLAARLVPFDRCAIALHRRGAYRVRAISGVDQIDAKSSATTALAERAASIADLRQPLYIADIDRTIVAAESEFVDRFRASLERDTVTSMYGVPLRDDRGSVGALVFEGQNAHLMTPHERELTSMFAALVTSGVRNARAHRLISTRIDSTLSTRSARRVAASLAAVAIAAMLVFVRWPLRIAGADASFRSVARSEIRPTVEGVIDRVFVREGTLVERGAPIMQLRDDELRARLNAARASLAAAERSGTIASARGDAANERIERLRADQLRREVELLDRQLAATIVRTPVSGVVLSARPEERIGAHVDEGELLLVIGRTDSLELDFTVDERDVARVHIGGEARLRVPALPQQTFDARVSMIELEPHTNGTTVQFPVRAMVANTNGVLRPGMAAYVRVLGEPASTVEHLTREPIRALRLLWWRIRP
jgi:RND family efflux transporter MFP subunit